MKAGFMRFVVAPDSFKGSLSSVEAGSAIRSGILAELPDAAIAVVPMADGGEGFVDALVAGTGGTRVELQATGPLGEKIAAFYGILGDRETAAIEMAATAGLPLVPADRRNPLRTTTFGVGECILHALDRGLRKFIVGLGGSATNDGGMGMLKALGVHFLDADGNSVPPVAAGLSRVMTVDYSRIDARLSASVIRGACDVDNPLCGPKGASFTYAAQKGATPLQIRELDVAMAHYADRVELHLKKSLRDAPGAGAAGGMGFALLSLGATLVPGAQLVCEAAGMEERLENADWLITGEGRSDGQTVHGKTPFYLASLAAKHGVPAILISGSIADDTGELGRHFRGLHSIVGGSVGVEEAMSNAASLLQRKTREIIRSLKESTR